MTKIYHDIPFYLDHDEALLTVAQVTAPSAAYQHVVPLNSLIITIIENQSGSGQSITIGDFQYQYLLDANTPLFYMQFHLYDSGPYYLQTCNSSGDVMSTTFDLMAGDLFSTVLVVAPGKFTFGPLD